MSAKKRAIVFFRSLIFTLSFLGSKPRSIEKDTECKLNERREENSSVTGNKRRGEAAARKERGGKRRWMSRDFGTHVPPSVDKVADRVSISFGLQIPIPIHRALCHAHAYSWAAHREDSDVYFFFCWSFLSSHSRFYWFRHSILANVGPAVCVRTVLEKSTPSLTSRVFSETPTASSTGRHKKPMGKKQRWKAVRVVRSIHRLASRRVTRFTLGVVCCRRRRLFCV